jgi:hypothetical protein
MKAVVMVIGLMLACMSTAAAQTDAGHKVKILSDKMDVLYLKVTPAYLDADVIVFDTNGHKVFQKHVCSKKVLLDFFNELPGDYVVHVEKGGFQQDLKYHKA